MPAPGSRPVAASMRSIGDLGVGAGRDEAAAALERAGDRPADRAGEHHEQQDRDQGAARVGREA